MLPSRSPTITDHQHLDVLATLIGDNLNVVTCFVLVSRGAHDARPHRLRQDERHPGAARRIIAACSLEMLEQFATRGLNLEPHLIPPDRPSSLAATGSLPSDLDGHIEDGARSPTRCSASKRFSPKVIFLGSYPRADRSAIAG